MKYRLNHVNYISDDMKRRQIEGLINDARADAKEKTPELLEIAEKAIEFTRKHEFAEAIKLLNIIEQ